MLRRQARLRREYIYRKSVENKERKLQEKKEELRSAINGKVLTVDERKELTALAAAVYVKEQLIARSFKNQTRIPCSESAQMSWRLQINVTNVDTMVDVKVGTKLVDDTHMKVFEINIDDDTFSVLDNLNFSSPLLETEVNGEKRLFQLSKRLGGGKYRLRYFGTVFPISVMDEKTAELAKFMPEKVEVDLLTAVTAPMPGMLKSISVSEGDSVSEGQEVAVLEAMKMQNSLVAGKTGKIKKVSFKTGETVDEGDILVELE